MKKYIIAIWLFTSSGLVQAEDGYRLWLRYDQVKDPLLLQQYRSGISNIYFSGYPFADKNEILASARKEMITGLEGLLGKRMTLQKPAGAGTVYIEKTNGAFASKHIKESDKQKIGKEGFIIKSIRNNSVPVLLLTANSDEGILYSVFHFLRLIQTHSPVNHIDISESPGVKLRLLNHWDNLDRTVERGYAGFSIWNWHLLPGYTDQRYIDYARANASVGINGTVLTNVNANARILTPQYLEKVAALASVFRRYGIKVYLTARFSAPIEIGGLKTADPLQDSVRNWWKEKVKQIYSIIPDFGGFLVKANSEGQPGPQNYNRNHADGANMLAEALAPFNGIVMWRAFVYSQQSDDRFKQAFEEFKPLDGQFRENVLVQVKNGPIDFQPREPFSPLFGAMEKTPLMMEFQITQEYLGQGTHLVYEAPMFKEVLDTDTYARGQNSTVAKTIDGSLFGHVLNGMAGVSNIGNERNWTGHLFGQANWYAFGRLAWKTSLTSEHIADEWLRQTFSNNAAFLSTAGRMMISSYEAMVNYMTPLGLHHIMGNGHHYGPAPWSDNLPRPDWNPVYYHKADAAGIGFDRTATGTNALQQYFPEVRKRINDPATCEEKFLLWFHHVSWDHKLKSGKTLWEELCYLYNHGVNEVIKMEEQWKSLEKFVDEERFRHVSMLLAIQLQEARWWRDACLLYFQTFSKKPIPAGYEQPAKTLEYYKSLRFPYAPGN